MKSSKDRYMVCMSVEYDKFIRVEDNRTLKEPHVLRLMEEMRRKGFYHSCPVVVNDRDTHGKMPGNRFRVVDGQHKLEAAKRLGIHFYYIVDNNVEPKEIISINVNRLTWRPQDYLDHYVLQNNREYIRLQQFVNNFDFSINLSVEMLRDQASGANSAKEFKAGEFSIRNLDKAVKAAGYIRSFQALYSNHKNMYFVRAMTKLAGVKKYKHLKMMEKMTKNWTTLKEYPSTQGYLEGLQKIYNANCQKANHLEFLS